MPALRGNRWLLAAGLLIGIPTLAWPSGGQIPRDSVVVTTGGVRLRYSDQGPHNNRPALLFIPGWGMDASIWRHQIERFSLTHRVVAVDPRSQGGSTKEFYGNTPEARAGDIAAVISALSLERVVLIGWSQGVQDVAAYVDQFGTRNLAGTVLVDAAVSAGAAGIEENPAVASQKFEQLVTYATNPREYLQGMMLAIFKKPMEEEERSRRVAMALRTPVSAGIAMLVQDFYGADLRPSLRKFDRPTLVVASADSPELDAQRKTVQTIPHAKLVEIKEAGHGVFVDQPERFNAALEAFVDSLER